MAYADINYTAVVVAAAASMVLGHLWYSPVLFGKRWMRLMNLSERKMKEMHKKAPYGYFWGAVAALVTSLVLAFFVDYAGATTISQGAKVGFILWLGLIATTTLGGVIWEGRSLRLYALNNGYSLVSAAVMGAILAMWI